MSVSLRRCFCRQPSRSDRWETLRDLVGVPYRQTFSFRLKMRRSDCRSQFVLRKEHRVRVSYRVGVRRKQIIWWGDSTPCNLLPFRRGLDACAAMSVLATENIISIVSAPLVAYVLK